jgi:hypothetical protein
MTRQKVETTYTSMHDSKGMMRGSVYVDAVEKVERWFKERSSNALNVHSHRPLQPASHHPAWDGHRGPHGSTRKYLGEVGRVVDGCHIQ